MVRQQKGLQKGSEGLFVELENRLEYLREMSEAWEERERLGMIGTLAVLLPIFALLGLAVNIYKLTEIFGTLLGFTIMAGIPSALAFWALKLIKEMPDNKPKIDYIFLDDTLQEMLRLINDEPEAFFGTACVKKDGIYTLIPEIQGFYETAYSKLSPEIKEEKGRDLEKLQTMIERYNSEKTYEAWLKEKDNDKELL